LLIVDDFELVRRRICSLLQEDPNLEVVSEASDGREAVERAQDLQPDVVLLDIGLPGLSGIEAARHIRRVAPKTEILFVSEHRTFEIVKEALSTGARGYVVKSDAVDELVAGVKAVSDHQRYVSARANFTNANMDA